MIVNPYLFGGGADQVGTCLFHSGSGLPDQTIPIYHSTGLFGDYAAFPTYFDVTQVGSDTAEYAAYSDLEGGYVLYRNVQDGDVFQEKEW